MAREFFTTREFPPELDRFTQMSHDFMVHDAAYDLRNASNEADRTNAQQRLDDLQRLRMLTYSYSKPMNQHMIFDRKNRMETFITFAPDVPSGQEAITGKLRGMFVTTPDINGQLRSPEAKRLFTLAIERAAQADKMKLGETRRKQPSM